MDGKKNIAIFGPHDRFNYGDILFPIILEYALNNAGLNNIYLPKYSLVNADLSSKGAYPSFSYRKLVKDINEHKIDVVIIAGGESLSASWHVLFGYINKFYFYLSKRRWIGPLLKKYDVARVLLGGKPGYPFCMNKSNFSGSINLIFNSVGGGIAGYNNEQKNALQLADHLALRDEASYHNALKLNKKALLVPDSAIIISDVFPRQNLLSDKYIRKEVRQLVERNESYLYFQVNKYISAGSVEVITAQLQRLGVRSGLKIVLCPTGTAPGHEDDIALRKIYESLSCCKFLLESPAIQEIIMLIANARVCIASGLHSIITAMSYVVPFEGIGFEGGKLHTYLNTWAVRPFRQMSPVDNFYEKVSGLICNDDFIDDYKANTCYQKKLYYESIKKIVDKIKARTRVGDDGK